MKKMLFFLLIILLQSCLFKQNPEMKELDKITSSFCKKMAKEKQLYLCGSGGAFRGAIHQVFLDFNSYKKVNLEEVRIMIVDITEELLKEINSNEFIREYLVQYPFKTENVETGIMFLDRSDNGWIKDMNFISNVTLYDSKLLFSICDHSIKNGNRLVEVKEEPYSEALRIVQEQRMVGNIAER